MRIRQSCTTTCQTAYQFNIHLWKGIDVIANSVSKIRTDIAPCNHEEADTRLILHALYCTKHGNCRILIRSVNTDVVVLWIATFHALSFGEIWIALGVKKYYRYIAVHTIAKQKKKRGGENFRALPFFHAFTGCDTTSSFSNVVKKTDWATWKAFSEITDTVNDLGSVPLSQSDENLNHLQRVYDSSLWQNKWMHKGWSCRKQLFAKEDK